MLDLFVRDVLIQWSLSFVWTSSHLCWNGSIVDLERKNYVNVFILSFRSYCFLSSCKCLQMMTKHLMCILRFVKFEVSNFYMYYLMQFFPRSILRFLCSIYAVHFNYWSVEFFVLSFCCYDLYECYTLVYSFIFSYLHFCFWSCFKSRLILPSFIYFNRLFLFRKAILWIHFKCKMHCSLGYKNLLG